jgi:hypothetical protein
MMERIEKRGISHELVLQSGPSADKIVSTARERKSDLIVIGLKVPHGVEKVQNYRKLAVNGKVLESSPCSVAIVQLD